MSKILVSCVALMVSRDAMTNVPAYVPAHEEDVLRAVFGAENVTPIEGEKPDAVELDPSTESERLLAKFGGDALEKTYGKSFAREIASACKAHEVKAAKPVKAAA